MASALHIKDSLVAILINLGNTFEEDDAFRRRWFLFPTVPLPRKGRWRALRPVRHAALKKAPSSTPALWRPSGGPQLWRLQGRVRGWKVMGHGCWSDGGIINDVYRLYVGKTEVGLI